MSNFLSSQTPPLNAMFCAASVAAPSTRKKKRRAPVSVRFSDEQHLQLEDLAGGKPLGTYIKDRLFTDAPPRRKTRGRNPVKDYEALARVLGALGQSELFANLDALVRQIESGMSELSPEAEEEIVSACACVLLMRNDLITALGLRTE